MPNVGTPSKGCKPCRDRKIKCDLKSPECGQCSRTKKICHGYRDALDMMFKDENEAVLKRTKKKYAVLSNSKSKELAVRRKHESEYQNPGVSAVSSKTRATSASEPASTRAPGPLQRSSTYPPIAPILISSLEVQGLGFRIANSVVKPSIMPRGDFDFLSAFFNGPNIEKVLQHSTNAVGLASLAISRKSPSVMRRAQDAYGKALQLTTQAVQSSTLVVKDSTLVSVLMLCFFEKMTYQGNDSVSLSKSHINGACALLKIRAEQTVKGFTSLDMGLVKQFYGTVLMSSLGMGMAVPDNMRDLWEACTRFGDGAGEGSWEDKMNNFVQASHDTIELTQDRTCAPIEGIERALRINRDLDNVQADIPDAWRYRTVHLEQPSQHVFGDYYDIYSDCWSVQVWNHLRLCRMTLHRYLRAQLTIQTQQKPLQRPMDDIMRQIDESERLSLECMSGICATIPQLTGQIPFPSRDPSSSQSLRAFPLPSQKLDEQSESQLRPPGFYLHPSRPTGLQINM
ncbi:hypothetical protein CC80DRAFT_476676, partial [Byssothecium circinans]